MSSAVKRFNVVKIILNKSIFDENIIHMILKYYWQLLDKRKVLLSWINIEWLSWDALSANPNAIDLLKIRIEYEYSLSSEDYNNLRHKIDWDNLCLNPNAIHLLENNQDKINWIWLSKNPSIFEDEPMPILKMITFLFIFIKWLQTNFTL